LQISAILSNKIRFNKEIISMNHLKNLLLLTLIILLPGAYTISFADTHKADSSIQKQIAELEASSGGRIGLYAINTANNAHIQYRSEERFPFQSTVKVIGVAAILKQSMTDNHLLQQMITYNKKDLVFWSPITAKHLTERASGMTVFDLCAAAVSHTDNTATNLLMIKLGGPKAVTEFARSIGDHTFRLDGWEPKLNSNPDELRDTSTPSAMAKSLEHLILGNVLGPSQRQQLVRWMKDNTTGNARIRAGIPQGWVVGDKTGSSLQYGITNDIAVIWPSHCAPIVLAVYFNQKFVDAPRRDDVIASATRILVNEFAQGDKCIMSATLANANV
jgi:beta-lactamase class A